MTCVFHQSWFFLPEIVARGFDFVNRRVRREVKDIIVRFTPEYAADLKAGAAAKQAELAQATANANAKLEEKKQQAKANYENFKQGEKARQAANKAIQAQGQHAYLAHGWSGLKKKAAEAKQKAIQAKEEMKKNKVIFDNAKAAAHAKALAKFNKLPDVQAGQTVSGMTTGTSLSGKSFEMGGGRRRRRRRKSRRKKKSKKKRGRKSRKKKRKRKTRKKRRRNRKKSRRRRRR